MSAHGSQVGGLYEVHGLLLRSEAELPITPSPTSQQEPDLVYEVAPHAEELPTPTHSRDDGTDAPWAVEQWIGDRLVVEFPKYAVFELFRDGVTLLTDLCDDPDMVAHLLLDHILPRVVSLRGDLMLHSAGAVGPSGRAHVFLGPTGAGKSTLATALAAGGWPLLDDDGIRVVERDSGPHAVPGYGGVRLLPDSAAAVLSGVPAGRPMSRGHDKRRFAVDGTHLAMAASPALIAAIYVLQRAEGEQASVERMGLSEALTAIIEQTFHFADEPQAITRKAFEQASALATAVPVWRLHNPSGLHRLDTTKAMIAQLDAS